jgi:hypothetical protein
VHQHYLLTDAGRDLLPVLHALAQWGDRHRPSAAGRLEVVHDACGQLTHSADTCTGCGVPLDPGSVSWRRPGDRLGAVPLVG